MLTATQLAAQLRQTAEADAALRLGRLLKVRL